MTNHDDYFLSDATMITTLYMMTIDGVTWAMFMITSSEHGLNIVGTLEGPWISWCSVAVRSSGYEVENFRKPNWLIRAWGWSKFLSCCPPCSFPINPKRSAIDALSSRQLAPLVPSNPAPTLHMLAFPLRFPYFCAISSIHGATPWRGHPQLGWVWPAPACGLFPARALPIVVALNKADTSEATEHIARVQAGDEGFNMVQPVEVGKMEHPPHLRSWLCWSVVGVGS